MTSTMKEAKNALAGKSEISGKSSTDCSDATSVAFIREYSQCFHIHCSKPEIYGLLPLFLYGINARNEQSSFSPYTAINELAVPSNQSYINIILSSTVTLPASFNWWSTNHHTCRSPAVRKRRCTWIRCWRSQQLGAIFRYNFLRSLFSSTK